MKAIQVSTTGTIFNAWLLPALAWILFILVMMIVMVCINTLLRVQWAERERLTYPIIQLPLEMAHPKSRFFKNKLMWFGFGIISVIVTVNILNSLYPSVPYIPIKRQDIHKYFYPSPMERNGWGTHLFLSFRHRH